MNSNTNPEKLMTCSFCGKRKEDVLRLIAGPSVFICNECIALCNQIVWEENSSNQENNSVEYDPANLSAKFIFQLLDNHFGKHNKNKIESVSHEIIAKNLPCPDETITKWLKSKKYKFKFVGITQRFHGKRLFLNLGELWEDETHPLYNGPKQYFLSSLTGKNNKKLKNGLWLCSTKESRFVIFLDHGPDLTSNGKDCLYLEIAAKHSDLDSLATSFFSVISKIQKKK